MKIFTVTLTQVLGVTLDVEAGSRNDAEVLALEMLRSNSLPYGLSIIEEHTEADEQPERHAA